MIMIVSLKKSISVVVNTFPETLITVEWIAFKQDYCLTCLTKEDLKFVDWFQITIVEMLKLFKF